jgi:fatty-acyl-CoA synthase
LLSPMAFLTKPRRWLRAMSDYKGTISPAPNFGYALAVRRVKPEDHAGLDLSSWRVALNGAEPVTMATVDAFTKTYAPFGFRREAVFPVYGLAESSLAVTFPAPGSAIRELHVSRARLADGVVELVDARDKSAVGFVCVGKAVPGHIVRVVDDEGCDQLPDTVGNVIAKGDSVMQGYFRNPEATSQTIVEGWLHTGDLGFVHEGELYVTGRAKDLVIVHGKNYYAEDIERFAERVEGARQGSCVAFGMYDEKEEKDRIVVVAETKLESEEERVALAQRISEAVSEGVGLPVDQVVIIPPGSLPKTSSGKRQRRRTKEAYLREELVQRRDGKFSVGLVYVRSTTGFLRMKTRRFLERLLGST